MQVQDAACTRLGRNLDRNLCYGPSDFRLGGVVPIFGRDLFVHDCDQFTRDWYKVNSHPLVHGFAFGCSPRQHSKKILGWPTATWRVECDSHYNLA